MKNSDRVTKWVKTPPYIRVKKFQSFKCHCTKMSMSETEKKEQWEKHKMAGATTKLSSLQWDSSHGK